MQKDKLEQFIEENKSSFDTEKPSDLLWQKIATDIESERGNEIPLKKYFIVAASAIVLLGLGMGVAMYWMQNKSTDKSEYLLVTELENYEDTEYYYMQRVNNSLDDLKQFDEVVDVELDLLQLDEVYEELRAELKNSNTGNIDVIMQAMIKNYQNKLKIIEKVRGKIEGKKLKKKIINNENLKI